MTEDSGPAAIALASFLLETADRRGSGWLELRSGADPIGTVVFCRGQLAWASCTQQREHLGLLLERLGYLTQEQLRKATSDMQRSGSGKKLGRVLEEAGLISRPVLRLCLLLHLRTAVASLLRQEDLTGEWEEGGFCTEDELAFPAQEILPSWLADATERLPRPPEDFASALLPLAELPGYQGALAADWMGRLLACHGFPGVDRTSATTLAAAAVSLLGGPYSLGRSNQGFLESENGAVVARWLDSGRRVLAAVRVGPDGRPGTALHRLSSLSPAVLCALDVQNEGVLAP